MVAAAPELRPQEKQEQFLSCLADIAIYGGSAGSGKTYALLLEPLYHTNNPGFNAVIFRRTLAEVKKTGGMLDESMKLYPHLGAALNLTELSWRFPLGSKISFGHLEHEKDVLSWHGAQIATIGFDELPTFSENQFFYLLSRNRSTCGVKPYVRASCNPDADSWVAKFLAWWIDQDTGYPIPERAGRVRWFVRDGDRIVWGATAADLRRDFPGSQPKSVAFFPAKLSDNQALMKADPGYLANLLAMPLVERERLLGGNWKVRHAAGKVFNRAWLPIVETAPLGGVECRFWDWAASEKKVAVNDPDYTAGVRIKRAMNGVFYVTDCRAFRLGPAEVEPQAMAVIRADVEEARRERTTYRAAWEVEGGSAAIRESRRLVSALAGIDCVGEGTHGLGDKVAKSKGLAAQAEGGNVRLVKGAWNEDFLTQLHAFPDAAHDDMVDAAGGAFRQLVKMTGGVPQVIASGGVPSTRLQMPPGSVPPGALGRIPSLVPLDQKAVAKAMAKFAKPH